MEKENLSKKLISLFWDLKILYVEDEDLIYKNMTRILRRICNTVDLAHNGKEGYEMYQQKDYDIIITDLEMPIKDGFWLIDKIREETLRQFIVVTTAYTDPAHIEGCLDRGVNGFISKPIRIESLFKRLQGFGLDLQKDLEIKRLKEEAESKVILENHQTLLSNISHHWRQPLNSISIGVTALEIELDEILTKEQKNSLERIHKIVQNLSKSIEEFRRIGTVDRENKEFDFVELVHDVQNIVQPVFEELKIQSKVSSETEEITYFAPKNAIGQIINSVCNNAIESIQRDLDNSPTSKEYFINFSLNTTENFIELKITDNGDQFSKDVLDSIFAPYSSAHKYDSGSGLSLYKAYKILKTSGGDIKIQNLEDGSTLVTCVFYKNAFINVDTEEKS